MAVYQSGIKGLFTEANPQDTPPETMKDCSDVVISRDNLAESRHGINARPLALVSGTWYTPSFEFANGEHTIFEAKFDAPVSGYDRKYVLLSSVGGMGEYSVPTGGNLSSSLNQATSGTPGFVNKPIGFTFDQSIYLVGTLGWMEMKKDVLDSSVAGIQKIIQWPPFTDIDIDTFQDTLDFSANWFDINKKVGIRFTYVWNTRYNDEQPREVESEPSQIFEVLHPMALRTQTASSTIANTMKEKSRIRIRVGESFTQSILPFADYVTGANNGRKYSLRVYRTKQVDIAEALPTEYFQAFPDIELGGSTRYAFANDTLVSSASDTIDFGATESTYWKNGSLFKYRASSNLIGGLTQDSFYYLGNQSSTTFQVYSSNLLTSPINLTAPTGNTAQYIIRVYEANLTVNDDGIVSLPQLYTNPNIDGAANSNTIPPIATSVIEYKNYQVAANIREPLRAYVSLVNQPLVRNITGKKTIGAGIPNGNYFFDTFDAANGASDLAGLTDNNFGIDSPFFRIYPEKSITFSGATVDVDGNSDLPIVISSGPTTGTTDFFFDANLVQTNSSMFFRFNGTTTVNARVRPKYNRTSPYTRYTSLPGAFPYVGAVSYDQNLEALQFAGTLDRPGFSTMPFYSVVTSGSGTAGKSGLNLGIFASAGTNVRGSRLPDIRGRGGATITESGSTVSIINVDFDISTFEEPGIIFYYSSDGFGFFTYKTVEATGPTTIRFNGYSISGIDNLGGTLTYAFYIPGSTVESAPFYFFNSPLSNTTSVQWINSVGSNLRIDASPLPVTGYYNQPIGVNNSKITTSNTYVDNPLFLGNLAKSPAQLIDDCVSELVLDLNEQISTSNVTGKVKFVKTDNVGEFYVEYYSGDKIEARIVGDYHSYEPEIIRSATEWTTLAQFSKNNFRAVSIGRYNAPESFPNSSILAPILVGSDKSKVVALAKNANDCFILKEDGIWRLSITGNASIPNVDSVVQIDTTTFCQAPYSVKEINEEIIFLSQKGFISIAGSDIEPIGRPIETEVKEKLQTCIANGLTNQIRAWVNEEKRIYGCTIPESATVYTTYVFSTYTRQWSKFGLPVLDGVTDSSGKTAYIIKQPYTTLGSGSTLQEQLNNATVAAAQTVYLAQEQHTSGQYRNEVDQFDFRYTPASVALGTGNQVVLTDNTSTLLDNRRRLGNTNALLLDRGINFFVGRPAYYKKAGLWYPCTFVSRNNTTATIEFADGVPANITTVSSDDGLYAGVPASITFNPSNVGTPNTNKMFSEYQLHTVESVSSLSMQFITDSRADFSSPRVFTFNRTATSRTVYRTYIPLEMMRGRWLIRKVNHSVPGERLQAASQSLSVRDTGSTLVQKASR